ncbi:hypothetical protein Aperf_G00000014488 [Anoplocephala perfoliata]
MAPMKQDSATFNMSCLLREWDRAPKERRRQLLQDFIDQHWNRSAPELELELAQMASLFLARICVWQVSFITHNFLNEFLQNGGILCLQELCVLPTAKEIDKFWALRVLSCVANGGTRYKETICECYGHCGVLKWNTLVSKPLLRPPWESGAEAALILDRADSSNLPSYDEDVRIRAVAECMAKSRSERTQEAARDVLEQLAEGNSRFRDRVYKGLIGVLPCDSAKAQQLALQSIRLLQTGNPVANRALIDRVTSIMESLHFSVQAAALELVRTLMSCDIADDIMKVLVALLHPQREIELGKLFTEAVEPFSDNSTSSSDGGSDGEDDDATLRPNVKASGRRDLCDHGIFENSYGYPLNLFFLLGNTLENVEAATDSTTTTTTEGGQLMVARPTKSTRPHHPRGESTVSTGRQRPSTSTDYSESVGPPPSTVPRQRRERQDKYDATLRRQKEEKAKKRRTKKKEVLNVEDQAILLPSPAFVQQASAAKCITVLIEDSVDLTKRLLKFGALSGLLYAMGNLEYPDSQRQASLAVKILCVKYPPIRSVVAQVMGYALYDEFFNKTEQFFVHMTPLQADLLVSSKNKFSGIDEINLDSDAS